MGQCKDCKWWQESRESREKDSVCLKVEQRGSLVRVVQVDHEGWFMPGDEFMQTHPDFGCIQFERQEGTTP